MNKKPLVSVLSLNFRNAQQAVRCTESFQHQTLKEELEMLVVDNGSNDDSIGILQNTISHLPYVHIVEAPHNEGFGAGYNYGARYAQGEFLLFNNPDKIPEQTVVEDMVNYMQQDSSIGIVAPRLMHKDGTRRYSARRFPDLFDCIIKRTFLKNIFTRRMNMYLQPDLSNQKPQSVDWVIGGCFMIRKSLFEQLQGFDDDFFLFFEDIDLCRRCHMLNKKVVYLPSSLAYDRKKRLSDGSVWSMITSKVGRAHIISALRYFWKWKMIPLPVQTSSQKT